MYHPVLLQPEVLRELPALLDDLRAPVAETASFSYRSEAFAEDLPGAEAVLPVATPPRRRLLAAKLLAAPFGLALMGVVAALIAHAH